MKYYKTKVKVRSGGNLLNFFIVEDLFDIHKMYNLEKSACHWFNKIEIGHVLEAVVCSGGNVLAVLNKVTEDTYDDGRLFKNNIR